MRRQRRLAASVGALLLFGTAHAARLPRPGGALAVVPGALAEAVELAQTGAPLVEPVPADEPRAERLAHPTLPGREARSTVLSALSPSVDLSAWTLRTDTPDRVAAATRACLGPGSVQWPAAALAAAGIDVEVITEDGDVVVRFDRSVGAAVALLSGCQVPGAGPFERADGELRGKAGRALLESVRLGDIDGELVAGRPGVGRSRSWAVAIPDVLVVLQDDEAARADPLGIREADLHGGLGADLLLAVFWGGRGAPARQLLPSGLVPGRPTLPPPAGAVTLDLGTLDAAAPTVSLATPAGDELAGGAADRLAVLLRSRGWAVASHGPRLQLARWRPATRDPALALLVLAAEHPALLPVPPALADRLLEAVPARRLEAALDLEARWLAEGRAVPLLTADRWWEGPRDLQGVRMRADGVPLLDRAWWSR